MKKLSICLATLLMIGSFPCFGQETKSSIERFEKGKIRLIDGSIEDMFEITIRDGRVTYVPLPGGTEKSFSLEDVYYLKLAKGKQFGRGAAYGAIAGASIAFLGALNVALRDDLVFKEEAPLIMLGIIGGGTGIGLMIGASNTRFKTYYEPHRHFTQRIKWSFGLTSGGLGVIVAL